MRRIAFGDSYTFVHGTAGREAYSFIGDYLPSNFSFTPKELLTDKIVQNYNGTSAGGPNWVEFLSGCGVADGLHSPAACDVQLWDFAFAGADVSEAFTPLHHDYTVPLVNQTQQYLTWAEPVIGRRIDKERALVAIWIGINDMNDLADYEGDFQALYDQILDAVFRQTVQPLYKAGYHDFLLVNLPPLDRTPGNVGVEEPSPSKQMLDWWNGSLDKHTARFAHGHKDATALVYDANSFLNRVLDHPAKYGFENTTAFCPGYADETVVTDPGKFGCTPIEGYFWFNSGHM